MSNAILVERHEGTIVIRFNRPEIRSPLSVSVLDLIDGVLDTVENSIETVVFAGSDGVFASGADLREIASLTVDSAPGFARRGQTLMNRIAALGQQTIAVINGACYGGALDLALACDRRIASPTATFCHPGAGLGIMTGWGGTQRLPRLVGESKALEMFFTAAPIDARKALKISLIEQIADDPEMAARVSYS